MNGKKIIIPVLFVLCLFFVGVTQAVSSENNITNYRETISVLQELYRAETTAAKTHTAFSQKALDEKYYSVARLFSALSESESVHARNFKNILNDLGVELQHSPEIDIEVDNTKKNLKWALKVELSEIDTHYPKIIERIQSEGNLSALEDITYAWQSEMQHRDLIKEMSSAIWLFFGKIVDKLKEAHEYHVCQRCGSTVFEVPEESCIICGSAVSMYKKIK